MVSWYGYLADHEGKWETWDAEGKKNANVWRNKETKRRSGQEVENLRLSRKHSASGKDAELRSVKLPRGEARNESSEE